MSNLQREKRLETANAGTARTDLKLTGVSVNITSTYQRSITLNPGTEFEEKIIQDHTQVTKQLYFDTTSDEQFANLQNLQDSVLSIAAENEAEAIAKYTIKGATSPEAAPEVASRLAVSSKTSAKA